MELGGLVTAALILYASVIVFQIITLPVELNASRRAKELIYQMGGYTQGGAKWRQPDAQRCRYDLFGFHIFGTCCNF